MTAEEVQRHTGLVTSADLNLNQPVLDAIVAPPGDHKRGIGFLRWTAKTAGSLDPDARPKVLRQGTQIIPPVTLLCDRQIE